MQIERLFKIVYYLLDKKNVTSKELMDYLGVSKHTILRDINKLSLAGIPIYTNKGKNGGIRLMDNFVLNKSVISEREQNEILSALQGFSAVKPQDTEQVLSKLSSFFNKASPNWIAVDFSGWNSNESAFFNDIKTAIFDKRITAFDYYNSYGEKRHRRVEPIQLRFETRAWYFNGFCLEKQGIRMYKLARVKNLVVTDEFFSERNLVESSVEDSSSEPEETFPNNITIVLKIAPERAYRVYDYYSEDQIIKNDDGSYTVTTTTTDPENDSLCEFVLSFGKYAEVLEPECLKDIIGETSLTISKKYIK